MVNMGINPGRRRLGGLIVGGALLGLVGQSVIPAHAASTPTWVSVKGKVVSLSLIAGYNNVNMGFNFDGAAHGKLVVTVPLGDTIDVTFQNKAKGVPHNVEFIDFTTNVPGGALAQPAFKGAETPQRRFPVGGRGTGNGGGSEAGAATAVADSAEPLPKSPRPFHLSPTSPASTCSCAPSPVMPWQGCGTPSWCPVRRPRQQPRFRHVHGRVHGERGFSGAENPSPLSWAHCLRGAHSIRRFVGRLKRRKRSAQPAKRTGRPGGH